MPSGPGATPAALRRAALAWALLHAPLLLLLYGPSLVGSLGGVPGRFDFALWPAFLVEVAVLSLLPFLLGLPLSPLPPVYRLAAPAVVGLATVAFTVDSQVYRALGFHVNGLVLRVLVQPRALEETGIPVWEVALFVAVGALWLAGEVWVGGRFIGWLAGRAPARSGWRAGAGVVVAALLAAGLAERVYVATLSFYGGQAVFAAGQVLPLQAPLRMNRFLSRLTGRRDTRFLDPLGGDAARAARALPSGVAADAVRFARTPDIVLVIIESIPEHLADSVTMPRLWGRAAGGARFTRAYASASSTHYALFGLFFGLQAQKLEATVGAGREPLLFGSLKRHGYQARLLAASSVDWMGLKQSVFGDVAGDLETDFPGVGQVRDSAMVARARAWVERADSTPVFLMLFFDGTHFAYTFPERSAVFLPYWRGGSALEAAGVASELIRNRARNAAHEVDRKLDEFLAWFAARRGREPLVVVTGDHGEEYRERGRIGHASSVTDAQVHVPMVLLGEGVPRGVFDAVTGHVDVVPTLFRLLGDTTAPPAYSDGFSMFAVPPDRYVLTGIGWEPRFAAIGRDLKVTFYGLDAGLGGVNVTDPFDRPLPDGRARLAAEAPHILRAFARHR